MGGVPSRGFSSSPFHRDSQVRQSSLGFGGILPSESSGGNTFSSNNHVQAHNVQPVSSTSTDNFNFVTSSKKVIDRGHGDIIKCLVGAQVNITLNVTDPYFSPLFVACHNGLPDVVASLLVESCDISSPDVHGCTPLYIACYKGHVEVVRILLHANVDVNVGKPPFSPLYAAAKNGYEDIVGLLLNHGANLYLCDSEDHLAYDVANKESIKQMLLEAHEHRGYGLCAICWELPIHGAFAFVPCGHNIVCRRCNDIMKHKSLRKCPMCRAEIWCRVPARFA